MSLPAARVAHLDGLRGIAILLVLSHHFIAPLITAPVSTPLAYLGRLLAAGYLGVDLFFVLSGYLIGGIILDHRSSTNFVSAFYIRRTIRILPLAYLYIAIVLWAQRAGLFSSFEGGLPWPWPVYLLFGTNFGMAATGDWGYRPLSPLWSLAIEEQFYLMIPWLVRMTALTRLPAVLLSLIAGAVLFRLLALKQGVNSIAIAFLPFGRLDSLSVGVLTAWTIRDSGVRTWLSVRASMLPWLAILFTLLVAALVRHDPSSTGQPMLSIGYTLVAAVCGVLLLYLEIRPASTMARMIASPPLGMLGRYSYFIYLFQGIIVGLTAGFLSQREFRILHISTWSQVILGCVVLVGLAAASWHWLESPLLAFGRRWRYSPDADRHPTHA